MAIFGKTDPEESRRLAEERKAKADQRRRENAQHEMQRRIGKAREHFLGSPAGLARAAKLDGDRWYQIEMPIIDTRRTLSSMLYGEITTKRRSSSGQGAVITAIEAEGWELFQAGFVFEETGAVSRDKFLSSGQTVQTTGTTMGVYLFKATDAPARDDEPWIEAVRDAIRAEEAG